MEMVLVQIIIIEIITKRTNGANTRFDIAIRVNFNVNVNITDGIKNIKIHTRYTKILKDDNIDTGLGYFHVNMMCQFIQNVLIKYWLFRKHQKQCQHQTS